jgi:hypothetical protein
MQLQKDGELFSFWIFKFYKIVKFLFVHSSKFFLKNNSQNRENKMPQKSRSFPLNTFLLCIMPILH